MSVSMNGFMVEKLGPMKEKMNCVVDQRIHGT